MNPLLIHRRTVRKRATVNELYSASPKCGDNRHTYATRFGFIVLLDFYYFHSIISCPPWQHLYFSYTAFAVEPFFS